jgi:hypothetical protein
MLHRSKKPPVAYALASAFVVLASCGTAPRPVAAPASANVVLPTTTGSVVHVQDSTGITTVGTTGGRSTAPGGIATPDWSTIFTIANDQLFTLDGVTGVERAAQPIGPGLRPVTASADGLYVALSDTPVRIGQSLFPAGRSRSTVVVASASPTGGQPRTIELDGNIVPEGFSTDHSRLFVIEFLPALHPDRYRVRGLDLASGQLGPVYTYDKSVDTEIMQGLSRTQVFSANGPNGAMLYTLYSRADGSIGGYGDVHALSLVGGLVHCTDLPPALSIGPAGGAITVSPDGQRVYVASTDGTVAEIDTSGSSQQLFPIIHTARLGGGSATIALAADDHAVWVALGTRLIALSSTGLQPVTASTVNAPLRALTITRGGIMYAATSTAIELIEPATGAATTVGRVDAEPTRMAAV